MNKLPIIQVVGTFSEAEQAQLIRAANDRAVTDRFAGLWVDVLETEPLPDGHPLFSGPNLLITPHITGGMHLDVTRRSILSICEENLKAWLSGEKLKSVLDWSTGYCSE